MQKRFCSCGHMVMVRYVCHDGVWQPRMRVRSKARRRCSGFTCPACGSPLTIHTLL